MRNRRTILFLFLILVQGAVSIVSAQKYAPWNHPVVRYVGNLEGKMVFQVDLKNEAGEPFTLTIKDDAGVVLFNSSFRTTSFSKKFGVDRYELDGPLTFIIQSKDKQPLVFKADMNSRVVEDVVVSRQ